MARSSWKFNFINSNIYKNIFKNKLKKTKITKLFCRSFSIPKLFLKKTVTLYKGSSFIKLLFTKYHIAYKSGEFGVTRKPFSFPRKDIKKKS